MDDLCHIRLLLYRPSLQLQPRTRGSSGARSEGSNCATSPHVMRDSINYWPELPPTHDKERTSCNVDLKHELLLFCGKREWMQTRARRDLGLMWADDVTYKEERIGVKCIHVKLHHLKPPLVVCISTIELSSVISYRHKALHPSPNTFLKLSIYQKHN